jgi:hypothetical protein
MSANILTLWVHFTNLDVAHSVMACEDERGACVQNLHKFMRSLSGESSYNNAQYCAKWPQNCLRKFVRALASANCMRRRVNLYV